MPVMFTRRIRQSTLRAGDTLLPFLYHTSTIQRSSLRYSSGGPALALDASLDGLASSKEETAGYMPTAQGQSSSNQSKNAEDIAARDGGSRGTSAGRRRILYPSLQMPHERTEAAKREHARQRAVDELNDVLSSATPASDARQYAPLYSTPSERRSSTEERADSFLPRRKKRPDDIPFANLRIEGEPSAGETSTITPSELKVFEKLFQTSVASSPSIAQATPRDAADSAKVKKLHGTPRLDRPPPELPAPLVALAKAAQRPYLRATQPATRTMPETAGMRTSTSAMLLSKKVSLWKGSWNKRLQAASTDHECWRILVDELDLTLQGLTHRDPVQRLHQTRLTAEVLPQALVNWVKTLRDHFPGSMLGLGVLPALKRLDPQAYASGCSTALYNSHMSMLYRHYTDMPAIIEVLEEMDREVYPFDEETHALLDKILYDARGVQEGVIEHLSPALSMLWSTERMHRAVRKVEEWRDIVEERRQTEALRLARQQEELDEVGAEEAAQGWMLKEGEYLRSNTLDGTATVPSVEEAEARQRKGLDVQKKVRALMPEGYRSKTKRVLRSDSRKRNRTKCEKTTKKEMSDT